MLTVSFSSINHAHGKQIIFSSRLSFSARLLPFVTCKPPVKFNVELQLKTIVVFMLVVMAPPLAGNLANHFTLAKQISDQRHFPKQAHSCKTFIFC